MGKLKLEGCQRAPTALAETPPLTCRKENTKVFDIKLGLNSAQEQLDDGDINKRRPKIRSRQVSVGSPQREPSLCRAVGLTEEQDEIRYRFSIATAD